MLSIFILLFGSFGCGGIEDNFNNNSPPSGDEDEVDIDMHLLVIDFQDGFREDTVLVQVNGKLISEVTDVTTSLLLGVASSVEASVPEGTATVTVSVPTQNIASSIDLEIFSETYIGVSIYNGNIEFIVSESPFGYG